MNNPKVEDKSIQLYFGLIAGLQGHLARAKGNKPDQEDFHLTIGALSHHKTLDRVIQNLVASINQCLIPIKGTEADKEREYFTEQLQKLGYPLRLKVYNSH